MTPTEGATVTTMERIEAALAHLAPDQESRDDWEPVEAALHFVEALDVYRIARAEHGNAVEALARLRARRDAAYQELFMAKIELMGRGEGTSMS